jgi:hypothetical protein
MKKTTFLLLFVPLFLNACATNLKQATYNHIISQRKQATLYHDYRRVLIMEAVYFDWRLRENFASGYSENYFTPVEPILAEQKEEYRQKYYFFVLTTFQDIGADLENENASWKFFLKDWNQDRYLPTEVERLKKKDLYYQYFTTLYPMDKWSELYLVKADRDFSITPEQNLILQLGNLQHKLQLQWKDPEFFFQP